jgi:hypothetical protein
MSETCVVPLITQRRLERSVTAEVTATRPHNDSPGLAATVAHSKLVAFREAAAMN